MRILVMNWKDLAHRNAGGAEVYTDEIAKAWVASGHEVTWFCAAVEGRSADETIHGVRIIREGGRFSVYAAARKWYLASGCGQFDLVIDEVNTRPFLALGYVKDAPVVALIHQVCREIWWQEMPLPVAFVGRFYLEGKWLRTYRSHRVLTVSESSRQSLLAYGLSDVTVVPEGVSPMSRPDVAKELAPTMVFVGRLAKNKRPADAIAAFQTIRTDFPTAQMWVVGDGPLRRRLEQAAPSGVTFFGRVDEATKHTLMAKAHVLVVTSVREGWGLVVDEAAAMATPSVAYDVPGLRDSVNAAGGTLTPADPGSLARAVAQEFRLLEKRGDTQGWRGGAVAWDDVAQSVLAAAAAGREDS